MPKAALIGSWFHQDGIIVGLIVNNLLRKETSLTIAHYYLVILLSIGDQNPSGHQTAGFQILISTKWWNKHGRSVMLEVRMLL